MDETSFVSDISAICDNPHNCAAAAQKGSKTCERWLIGAFVKVFATNFIQGDSLSFSVVLHHAIRCNAAAGVIAWLLRRQCTA